MIPVRMKKKNVRLAKGWRTDGQASWNDCHEQNKRLEYMYSTNKQLHPTVVQWSKYWRKSKQKSSLPKKKMKTEDSGQT